MTERQSARDGAFESREVTIVRSFAELEVLPIDSVVANVHFLRCEGTASFEDMVFEHCSFEACTLDEIRLKRVDLRKCKFSDCTAAAVSVVDGSLKELSFDGCVLAGVKISGAAIEAIGVQKSAVPGLEVLSTNAESVQVSSCGLNAISVKQSQIFSASVTESTLIDARVDQSKFEGLALNGADCSGSLFRASNLGDSRFVGCKLLKAAFPDSELQRTSFANCDLTESSFRDSSTGTQTDFGGCNIEGAVFDRWALLGLDHGARGGISRRQLAGLRIEDDVLVLRGMFGGFWFWVHLAATLGFTAPYLLFVLSLYAYSGTSGPIGERESLTIGEALARYVWNGGQDWRQGWNLDGLSFSLFVVCLHFNLTRAALSWKTKADQTREEVSAIPSAFVLGGVWKVLVAQHKFGSPFYFGAVLINTALLMMRRFIIF